MPRSAAHPPSKPTRRATRAPQWSFTPQEAIRRWPTDLPLVALWSAGRSQGRAQRWTILARPVRRIVVPASHRSDPLGPLRPVLSRALRRTTDAQRGAPPFEGGLPFQGGWIGLLSYELGARLEPVARDHGPRNPEPPNPWPLADWSYCPAAYIYDNLHRRWSVVGPAAAVARLPPLHRLAPADQPFTLGPLSSRTGRADYQRAVRQTVRDIRNGVLFQANLAHHLAAPFAGSTRALFLDLVRIAAPAYGAYLELPALRRGRPARAVVSVSPELFLSLEPASTGWSITTRPIKGTRPAGGGASAADLARSQKDRAELNMIVDLMRNDLGRVCRYGTVRVDEARRIERHGATAAGNPAAGVLHGVATVSGLLRDDVRLADILRAAFPPGSVTGAPKIKAMQVIDHHEPFRRGPYCGAIGYISNCGRAGLNVAIRTAAITGRPVPGSAGALTRATLDYAVGAGIVADSDPAAEWQETLDKAAAIRSLAPLPTRPPQARTRPAR